MPKTTFEPGLPGGPSKITRYTPVMVEVGPDKVWYSGGSQSPGFGPSLANTFTLFVNLTAEDQSFGIRQIATVPEPTTLAFLGVGLAGIGYRRYKAA